MLSTNELMELMKKAKVQPREGYNQIHALRFCVTFKRNKRKYSEAEFRSIAEAKGVELGGYQDLKALLNQGRDIYRRLELITDRDLAEEIQPLPMFEDPELFPTEETPEPERSQIEALGHTVHIARTIDTISLKMNESISKLDQLIGLETKAMHHVLAAEKPEARE